LFSSLPTYGFNPCSTSGHPVNVRLDATHAPGVAVPRPACRDEGFAGRGCNASREQSPLRPRPTPPLAPDPPDTCVKVRPNRMRFGTPRAFWRGGPGLPARDSRIAEAMRAANNPRGDATFIPNCSRDAVLNPAGEIRGMQFNTLDDTATSFKRSRLPCAMASGLRASVCSVRPACSRGSRASSLSWSRDAR
jgi:hypothetical protein